MLSIEEEGTVKSFKLYDGHEIRLYVESESNQYPSVTSLTGLTDKEWLLNWQKNEPHWKEIQVYAATVGVLSHWRFSCELAEEWGLPKDVLSFSKEQQKAMHDWYDEFPYSSKRKGIKDAVSINMALFYEWKDKIKPKPPFIIKNGVKREANISPSETKITSNKFGFSGRVDLICSIFDNKLSEEINIIDDFKTNFVVTPSYKLQLSGYKVGFNEMYPNVEIKKLFITNISPIEFEWNFTEQLFNKKTWLEIVAKFYWNYGGMPQFKKTSEKVLKNIDNEKLGVVYKPKKEKKH